MEDEKRNRIIIVGDSGAGLNYLKMKKIATRYAEQMGMSIEEILNSINNVLNPPRKLSSLKLLLPEEIQIDNKKNKKQNWKKKKYFE